MPQAAALLLGDVRKGPSACYGRASSTAAFSYHRRKCGRRWRAHIGTRVTLPLALPRAAVEPCRAHRSTSTHLCWLMRGANSQTQSLLVKPVRNERTHRDLLFHGLCFLVSGCENAGYFAARSIHVATWLASTTPGTHTLSRLQIYLRLILC